jgi:hypothetical protein
MPEHQLPPPPPPHKPPWYPNQSPEHNPWLLAEPIAGLTYYQVWVNSLPPGRLLELIAEHRAREEAAAGEGEVS